MDPDTLFRTVFHHSIGFNKSTVDDDVWASVATDMPLIGSPWPSVFILGIYWVSVKHIGPTIMKHRDPVDVKNWIITYNIYQIMANAILCYCTIREMTRPDNNLFCLQVSRSSAMLCYLYFLNKLTDLTETFFFVLKKSWRQISYLHLYHHVAIVTCSYVDFYIQPGGLSMFMLLLNTFVHVVMYIYYLLSIWKPSLSMLPKFKRTVTQIQLAQFVIALHVLFGTLFLVDRVSCADKKPAFTIVLGIVQCLYFIYIFGSFYVKTYVKSKLN